MKKKYHFSFFFIQTDLDLKSINTLRRTAQVIKTPIQQPTCSESGKIITHKMSTETHTTYLDFKDFILLLEKTYLKNIAEIC